MHRNAKVNSLSLSLITCRAAAAAKSHSKCPCPSCAASASASASGDCVRATRVHSEKLGKNNKVERTHRKPPNTQPPCLPLSFACTHNYFVLEQTNETTNREESRADRSRVKPKTVQRRTERTNNSVASIFEQRKAKLDKEKAKLYGVSTKKAKSNECSIRKTS